MSINELEAEKQAMQEMLDKLKQDVSNADDSEKVKLNREIRIDERYLKDIEKLLAEKNASEGQVVEETNSELLQLKETWATSQIDSALSAAGIEWKLIDETWKADLDTVKEYLQYVVEHSTDQSSLVNFLNNESQWSGCWSTCVQIALTKLWYDCKGIDWLIWKETKAATKQFQEAYNEKHSGALKPDSHPWYETTKALLEEIKALLNTDWGEAGSDTVNDTGGDTNSDTDSDTGGDTVNDTDNDTGGDTVNDTGENESAEKNSDKFNVAVFNELVNKANNTISSKNMSVLVQTSTSSSTTWAFTYTVNDKNNPYYYPTIILPNNLWQTSININLHDYLTSNNTFDEQRFGEELEQIEKSYSFIKGIRWKEYSYTDIFWKNSTPDVYEQAFMNKFKNKKILIDSSPSYTYYTKDALIVQLDKQWIDKKRCKREIKREKIKNKDSFSEDMFKKELKKQIEDILKNDFWKPEN